MFDLSGNVIGVNSQILSPTGGNIGIGFAIPAEEAKPVIDTLMKGGSVQRGYLGIAMQELTNDIADQLKVPHDLGTIVTRVEPGEAAEKAGIKEGDVIVKVAGKDVTPDQTLSYVVAKIAPGSRVPVELIRDGKRVTLTATVGTRPAEEKLAGFDPDDENAAPADNEGLAAASLGVAVTPLTPQIAQQLGLAQSAQGAVIEQVNPSSDAAGKGLRRGDLIVSVNRQPVATGADIAKAVTAARGTGDSQVLLHVQRRNLSRFVVVQIQG